MMSCGTLRKQAETGSLVFIFVQRDVDREEATVNMRVKKEDHVTFTVLWIQLHMISYKTIIICCCFFLTFNNNQ